MRLTGRAALGLVVGGFLLGAMASAGAYDRPGTAPVQKQPGAGVQQPGPRGKGPGFGHNGFGPRAPMRSESVFPGQDGGPVRTVRTDRGELKAIDGKTLQILEQDGTTVKVAVADDTRIRRDGQEARLQDLKAGDQVFTMRVKEGSGELRTKGVNAVSAERYREMEARREQCRKDPAQCPRKRGWGPGGGAAPRPDGGPRPDASFENGDGPDVFF